MPRKSNPTESVCGPYRHGQKWRVVLRGRDGSQVAESFATEGEAKAHKRAVERQLAKQQALTVLEALDRYEEHQLKAAHLKVRSVATTRLRLVEFFKPELETLMPSLGEKDIQRLYGRYQQNRAVATHKGALAQAKTFLTWAVDQRIIPTNPAIAVKGVGRKKRGKKQLRLDEAKKWLAKALELGREWPGAGAATLSLVMGMRASEIANLKVRDLDAGGTLLVIEEAKTQAGNRTLEVPEVLRPLLLRYVRGKRREAPLFGVTRYVVSWWAKGICSRAGVPVVCAHGLRGTHASLAVIAGATSHQVVGALGHESFEMTRNHYLANNAIDVAQGRNAEQKLVMETRNKITNGVSSQPSA